MSNRFRNTIKHLKKGNKLNSKKKKERDLLDTQLEKVKIYQDKPRELLEDSKNQLSTPNQNLEKQSLTFCDECGQLMLPTKIGDKIVIKCKCGITKPFSEVMTNSYKITMNIGHPFNQESIYRCICGNKFSTYATFLDHTAICQKCKEYNIEHLKRSEERKFHEKVQKQEMKKSIKRSKINWEKEFSRKAKLIYQCACGKEYSSPNELLKHSSTCKICKEKKITRHSIRRFIKNKMEEGTISRIKAISMNKLEAIREAVRLENKLREKYKKEIKHLERHLNCDCSICRQLKKNIIWYDKGVHYRKLGEYEKAAECFMNALLTNPAKYNTNLYKNLFNSIFSK